jgi:hypothetical protein
MFGYVYVCIYMCVCIHSMISRYLLVSMLLFTARMQFLHVSVIKMCILGCGRNLGCHKHKHTAILVIVEGLKQLSTIFSTSLLLENRSKI